MALIACPECSREVSDRAVACPTCAYPLGGRTPAPPAGVAESSGREWWKLGLSLLGRIALGMMLVGVGLDGEEVTGIIGGLVIAASAIPTWYRYRLDKARGGPGAANRLVEARMAEIEQTVREQMGQMHQAHQAELAELEERMDFAERVLTKRREQIGPG
jgi:hypothetical protein